MMCWQVWSSGQWRGIPHTELWACSLPHAVQNCLGAVECLLCDGHTCDEEGERLRVWLLTLHWICRYDLCFIYSFYHRCIRVKWIIESVLWLLSSPFHIQWPTHVVSGCFRRKMTFPAVTWVVSSDRVLSLLLLLCLHFTEAHLKMAPSYLKHR